MPNVVTKLRRDVLEACLVVPSKIPTVLTVKPSALTVMMVAAVEKLYGGEKGLGGRQHCVEDFIESTSGVGHNSVSYSCKVTRTTVRNACLGKTCAHLIIGSKSAMAAKLPTNTLGSSETNPTTWILRECGPELGH